MQKSRTIRTRLLTLPRERRSHVSHDRVRLHVRGRRSRVHVMHQRTKLTFDGLGGRLPGLWRKLMFPRCRSLAVYKALVVDGTLFVAQLVFDLRHNAVQSVGSALGSFFGWCMHVVNNAHVLLRPSVHQLDQVVVLHDTPRTKPLVCQG